MSPFAATDDSHEELLNCYSSGDFELNRNYQMLESIVTSWWTCLEHDKDAFSTVLSRNFSDMINKTIKLNVPLYSA